MALSILFMGESKIRILPYRCWAFESEVINYKPKKKIVRKCEVCNSTYVTRKTSKKYLRRYCSVNCAENPKKVRHLDCRLTSIPGIFDVQYSLAESECDLFWQTVEAVKITIYMQVWNKYPSPKAYKKIIKEIEELKKEYVFRSIYE